MLCHTHILYCVEFAFTTLIDLLLPFLRYWLHATAHDNSNFEEFFFRRMCLPQQFVVPNQFPCLIVASQVCQSSALQLPPAHFDCLCYFSFFSLLLNFVLFESYHCLLFNSCLEILHCFCLSTSTYFDNCLQLAEQFAISIHHQESTHFSIFDIELDGLECFFSKTVGELVSNFFYPDCFKRQDFAHSVQDQFLVCSEPRSIETLCLHLFVPLVHLRLSIVLQCVKGSLLHDSGALLFATFQQCFDLG